MTDPSTTKLYYSISEVSRLTGLKQHVLRYWETEFPSLRPRKNRAGNRTYRIKDIKLIFLIKRLLYTEKYTIEGAREKLKKPHEELADQLELSFEELQIRDLLFHIRQELKELLVVVNRRQPAVPER
ncbi:MAG: MerR family transcriptional regulator [Gemmatimonadota bacterium]|nr:MAG: MerR family transcriptional regulator [Gemmatimonadota bacterium]